MSDERAAAVERVLAAHGTPASVERLEQLQGGWSRHSYVAHLAGGERRIVRVRPPGALLDTDLELEYRVYEALEPADVPTPTVHGLEPSGDTPFGGPFFVMSFMPGDAPNQYGKADQAMLAADFDGPRGIATDMVRTLAAIHRLDAEALPPAVPRLAYPEVVERWRQVYEERRLVRDPVIEEGYAWLTDHAPARARHGLVHGDYRIGNTLVHDGRLTAVLDWELVHVGDVRFDLGYVALERSAGKHLRRRAAADGHVRRPRLVPRALRRADRRAGHRPGARAVPDAEHHDAARDADHRGLDARQRPDAGLPDGVGTQLIPRPARRHGEVDAMVSNGAPRRGICVFATSIEAMAQAAADADAAGFDAVWTSELYNRSATVTVAACATATSAARSAPGSSTASGAAR